MLAGPKQRKRTRRPARAHRRAGSPKCTRTFETCVKRRALCKTLVSLGETRCKHKCEPKTEPVTIDYTFGLDEISQTVDDGTTTTTHVFGHDGHGSVRVLYDLATTAANIAQAFTFAAHGGTLAVHDSTGTIQATSAVLSSLGYSGEFFDTSAQQQYLRARFYNPATGRFNRLDPFAGNMQDPQSLHKYAYGHGDPVQGVDPSGLVTIGGIQISLGTIAKMVAIGAPVAYTGLAIAKGLKDNFSKFLASGTGGKDVKKVVTHALDTLEKR